MRNRVSSRFFLQEFVVLSITISLLILSFFFMSCAKEVSAEDKKREEDRRQIARLSKAVGEYEGFAETEEGQAIPAYLNLTIQNNPSNAGDAPSLQASLTLGLFGGLSMSSKATSYDRGASKMTAAFGLLANPTGGDPSGSGAKGKTLELYSIVRDEGLTDAYLKGSSGKTYPVTLKKCDGKCSQDSSSDAKFSYELSITTDQATTLTVLDLSRETGEVKAPENSDMPALPVLSATIKFPGTAQVPQMAKDVLYDPLDGSFELTFTSSEGVKEPLRFLFKNVFYPRNPSDISFSFLWDGAMEGAIEFNSAPFGRLVASPIALPLKQEMAPQDLPPRYFSGRYQATRDSYEFPAIAYLDYQGTEGKNTGEFPFQSFPNLKLRVVLCVDGELFAEKLLALSSFDHLDALGRFTDTEKDSDSLLQTTVQNNGKKSWNQLSGIFINKTTGSETQPVGGETPAQIELTATEGDQTPNCYSTLPLDKVLKPSTDTRSSEESAQKGSLTYYGFLTSKSGERSPLSLAVFPVRNPSSEGEVPSLQSSIRVGFFGGVTLSSESTYFDWSTGKITSSFKRPSGTPLELKTTLTADVLTNAVLLGPGSGAMPLNLSRRGPQYSHGSLETFFNLQLTPSGATYNPQESPSAILSVKRKREDITAPANSDLPFLPALETSIKLDGIAQTPQTGKRVIYDPLKGSLDIQLTDNSSIEFFNIFLNHNLNDNPDYSSGLDLLPRLQGSLYLAGSEISTVHAQVARDTQLAPLKDLPSKTFLGVFTPSVGTAPERQVVIFLDYQGTAGLNTAEYAFPLFPNLKMTVILCNGTEQLGEKRLQLSSLDYLSGNALFKSSTGNKNDLDVHFSKAWDEIAGSFKNTSEGSSGSGTIRATLTAGAVDPSNAACGM